MRRALLLYTAGHTDVQLVEGEHRRELDKGRAGRIHEQLAQRSDWVLAEAKPKARKPPRGRALDDADGDLPATALQLCTPKLDAVLAYLDEQRLQLAHALILHTDRPDKDDPTQAGPILQRRLRERSPCSSTLVSYLSGAKETLEDPRTPGEEILRREVVRRLDAAISEALTHPEGPFDVVVTSVLGGIPKVQSVVLELAHLHAGNLSSIELEVPEAKGETAERAVQRSHKTDPSAVVAATRHALALVERGDLIAARGAVEHLEGAGRVSLVFRWLHEWAASLPHEPDCEPPSDLLPSCDQRALATALRVELALRRGDTARAIQGTFAFFEAALLDVLYRDYIRDVTELDGRMAFTLLPAPTESLMKDVQKAFRLASSDPQRHYLQNFGDGAFAICRQYIAKLQPGSAAAVSLLALADAVSNIKRLRDLVSHGEPNRERLRRAAATMQQHRLWSSPSSGSAGPSTVLGQPLFHDVLAALGSPPIAKACDQLLAATRAYALAAWRSP